MKLSPEEFSNPLVSKIFTEKFTFQIKSFNSPSHLTPSIIPLEYMLSISMETAAVLEKTTTPEQAGRHFYTQL